MRILITNDDGINAPGLQALYAIATELAGPDGQVVTVAPAFEQSGVGHSISYTRPMMIAELGPDRFAAEGSPADCVLAGLYDVMADAPPDLVLSGVNRGNNSGENTLYSGTIGATLEAVLHGVPAVALSQYYGPAMAGVDDIFEGARTHAPGLLRKLIDHGVWGDKDYGVFYSVNFPPCPAADVKGVKAVSQGFRRGTHFGVEPHFSPSGRKFLWVKGGAQHQPTDPGTDVWANLDGYVSVTPMRADLTAHETLPQIARLFPESTE